jgi:hypothetical protein
MTLENLVVAKREGSYLVLKRIEAEPEGSPFHIEIMTSRDVAANYQEGQIVAFEIYNAAGSRTILKRSPFINKEQNRLGFLFTDGGWVSFGAQNVNNIRVSGHILLEHFKNWSKGAAIKVKIKLPPKAARPIDPKLLNKKGDDKSTIAEMLNMAPPSDD